MTLQYDFMEKKVVPWSNNYYKHTKHTFCGESYVFGSTELTFGKGQNYMCHHNDRVVQASVEGFDAEICHWTLLAAIEVHS